MNRRAARWAVMVACCLGFLFFSDGMAWWRSLGVWMCACMVGMQLERLASKK